MSLAARLCPDPLGSYTAPPDSLVVRGRGGMEGLGIGRGRNGREGKDMKG